MFKYTLIAAYFSIFFWTCIVSRIFLPFCVSGKKICNSWKSPGILFWHVSGHPAVKGMVLCFVCNEFLLELHFSWTFPDGSIFVKTNKHIPIKIWVMYRVKYVFEIRHTISNLCINSDCDTLFFKAAQFHRYFVIWLPIYSC